MSTLRAFKATTSDEEFSVIIVAESAAKARSAVYGYEWFGNEDFLDFSVHREKTADAFIPQPAQAEVWIWERVKYRRLYRAMGYRMHDADECDHCGMFEDEEIPESRLVVNEDGVAECRECAGG